MKFKELITRYILFIFAASLVGSGIAIITSSSIGTTPISSATYEVSLHSGLSLGTVTFLFNFLLVVLQALIIPRNQVKANLLNFALQIFITFIFSIAIDLVMMLIRHLFTISDLPYWGCAVFLLTGIAVMAVGICLEIIANVVMVPGEALLKWYRSGLTSLLV